MHQVSLHKITSLVCRENNYKLYYLFSREIWRERERERVRVMKILSFIKLYIFFTFRMFN